MNRHPGARLRELLETETMLVVPGVTNPFTARLAEQAGFPCLFATGAGVANEAFGIPDIGLLGLADVAPVMARICGAVDVPVIVDADDGYGGPLSVVRTVRDLEAAGAAGLMLEDQRAPKRCGHFPGKAVTPTADMIAKIRAFHSARSSEDLVLMSRTDALATEGLEGAVARALAYAGAGADLVFIEAPTTDYELREIPPRVSPHRAVANMVEGGVTPMKTAEELRAMGYRMVLYANTAMRAAAYAARRALISLRQSGDSSHVTGEILSWDERQELVSLTSWQSLEGQLEADVPDQAATRLDEPGLQVGRPKP